MSKITIFQESLLVTGIMCFEGCGNTIQASLRFCIDECIEKKILPSDAQLIVDAEPNGLGIHKLIISIESEQDNFITGEHFHSKLSAKIKEDLLFDIIDDSEETNYKKSSWSNGKNILINLISMGIVVAFTLIFPPSILLTVGLTTLSFLTTAFTSREYLLAFFHNFQTKSFVNMATTISLGWFLSLAHTLFHAITMPLTAGFSMAFMSFIMPLMLVTCINGMDELKRLIMDKSKKIQLKGMKTLFPQMSEKYSCYQLSQENFDILSHKINSAINQNITITSSSVEDEDENESLSLIQNILATAQVTESKKSSLTAGMLIEVKPGECFPVDCILVQGNTVIDASLLTGEAQQSKQLWQNIPAGAINLGQTVTVYALKNPYNSTVNSLLFRSNRARNAAVANAEIPNFAYFYTALILLGMVGSILVPVAFGVITVPLVMQNVIGILFSMCPCTVAIAHQLPKLISIHHRNSKGIHLRDDSLIDADSDEIHTVVFDKTGTLTTGNAVVESSDIALESPLWQRIYLLEKTYGREHPLAKAIQKYYEATTKEQPLFDEIKECKIDAKNRGLTARVQGKALQIGSYDYLKDNNIILPELDKSKMEQGFSAVCVAEEGCYKGAIYIKHEVRKGVLKALTDLKEQDKTIIMLTGDNRISAIGFNQQINSIFEKENIYTGQTPQDKEFFLNAWMSKPGVNPKGVWFCGDGLNDAPCCRIVSEKGGISCSMSSNDKSSFFTDISLNGTLDYLFKHRELNRSLRQNIDQNKGILIYSTIAFLAFIISFSTVGIAVPPLIPMAIMMSTTLFILFNSYRIQPAIDQALDKYTSWPKNILSSNLSIGLLLGASSLLICGILAATITTGGLKLPLFTFGAGAVAAFSSICTLSALGLSGAFMIVLTTSLLSEQQPPQEKESIPNVNETEINASLSVSEKFTIGKERSYGNFFLSYPENSSGQEQTINNNEAYQSTQCIL